jgi:hypothetical protein
MCEVTASLPSGGKEITEGRCRGQQVARQRSRVPIASSTQADASRVRRSFRKVVVAWLVPGGHHPLLIWYGPDVITRHDVGDVTGPLQVLCLQPLLVECA